MLLHGLVLMPRNHDKLNPMCKLLRNRQRMHYNFPPFFSTSLKVYHEPKHVSTRQSSPGDRHARLRRARDDVRVFFHSFTAWYKVTVPSMKERAWTFLNPAAASFLTKSDALKKRCADSVR